MQAALREIANLFNLLSFRRSLVHLLTNTTNVADRYTKLEEAFRELDSRQVQWLTSTSANTGNLVSTEYIPHLPGLDSLEGTCKILLKVHKSVF